MGSIVWGETIENIYHHKTTDLLTLICMCFMSLYEHIRCVASNRKSLNVRSYLSTRAPYDLGKRCVRCADNKD